MLSETWTKLRPHKEQSRLWRSPNRMKVVVAGRGSGKSEISKRFTVRQLPVNKPWPDPLYFYGLPTYSQAKRVGWDKILPLVPREWIRKKSESGLWIETIHGAKLYIVGLDQPSRVEGLQWDGCIIDECSDIKPGTFGRSILPALSHRDGFCWQIGVPKRYGKGAKEFRKYFELGLAGKPIPGTDQKLESFHWASKSVLTKAQLAVAMGTLDAKDFNEQYNASWEEAGGAVFFAFTEKLNVQHRAMYRQDREIIVGVDFNVNPMCWVLCHMVDGVLHVFDEVFIRNTHTAACLKHLHHAYGSHKMGWKFIGDASSNSRKTSAPLTDYIQIYNYEPLHPRTVDFPSANPRVQDRFASTNAALRNVKHEVRCIINPKCVHLIADLKARVYKEGFNIPADSGDIGHITDALGYIIHRIMPMRVITGDEMSSQVGVF